MMHPDLIAQVAAERQASRRVEARMARRRAASRPSAVTRAGLCLIRAGLSLVGRGHAGPHVGHAPLAEHLAAEAATAGGSTTVVVLDVCTSVTLRRVEAARG